MDDFLNDEDLLLLEDEEEYEYEPTLQALIDQRGLKWIFVGGKGGVGKTTCSCSIAVLLSRVRERVLLVSTDPAHNLSDAFGQKFSHKPTLVNGTRNLYALEMDGSEQEGMFEGGGAMMEGILPDMKGMMKSLPGIEESFSFFNVLKQVQRMDYEVVVFDTAPTGHTLKLLNFPSTIGDQLGGMMGGNLQGMMDAVGNMLGGLNVQNGLRETKQVTEEISNLLKDAAHTSFVCVCIPEFLSLYETERLIQELQEFEVNSENILINQVIQENNSCKLCSSRMAMQGKYIGQMHQLYKDFHRVTLPLLYEEVRGLDKINRFATMLLDPSTRVPF